MLKTLTWLLAIAVLVSVSSVTPSIEAKRRAITKQNELIRFLGLGSKTIEEKLAAINEVKMDKASIVRGLVAVWEEIEKDRLKNPSRANNDMANALLEKISAIDDLEVCKDLHEDVLDTEIEVKIRAAFFGSIIKDESDFVSDLCVKLADDQQVTMRMNAIDELGERHYKEGFSVCMNRLRDGANRVQAAALDAVAAYANYDKAYLEPVVTELITVFMQNSRNIGMGLHNCRAILVKLTRQDIGVDPEAWLEWWRAQRPENKDRKVEERKDGAKTKVNTIWDVETTSTKLIFVIDTSISMAEPIEVKIVARTGESEEEKRRNKGIDWEKVKSKLDLARAELKQYINMMEPHEFFTIVSYHTTVQTWQEEIVPATKENLEDAHVFLDKLATGKLTNIYGALNRAFEIAEAAFDENQDPKDKKKKKKKRDDSSTGTGDDEDVEPLVPDTIVFLTDGFATAGDYTGPKITGQGTKEDAEAYNKVMKEMLKEIELRNKIARLTIHAVAVGKDADKWTLKALAKAHKGDFRELIRGGNAPDAKGKK